MKKLMTLLALFTATQAFAQHDKKSDQLQKDLAVQYDTAAHGWKKGGILTIGINEGILENWASGGERMSLALNGQFSGFLNHLKKNKVFENKLDLYYGLSYVASNHFVPRKLDDRIDFSSRYSLHPQNWENSKSKFKRGLYLTGLFRFQSQFSKGYNYENPLWAANPTTEFLSPGYFTLALGASYRPNENFSVFLSPLAARVTVVKSKYTLNASAFGVEKGKTSRSELGAYLTTTYKAKINKQVSYNTRLDLYSNYLAKNRIENGLLIKDNPGNIDILWDNTFNIKLTKFVGANFGLTWFYDNDQPGQKNKDSKDAAGNPIKVYGPLQWWQMKQVLTIGFNYKL